MLADQRYRQIHESMVTYLLNRAYDTPMFTEKEKEYIKSQRLARIATTSKDNLQPDVVPVGFDFDGMNFFVSGKNLLKSTKYKNILRNNKVALTVDDLKPGESWEPRGIRIYGNAVLTNDHEGYMGRTSYLKITPNKKWSWGIEAPVFVAGRFVVNRS